MTTRDKYFMDEEFSDPTYGVALSLDDKVKIERLLVEAHNLLAEFMPKIAYNTGDLKLALPEVDVLKKCILVMWRVMAAKEHFPAEWDSKLNGEVIGYRRAHLAIVDAVALMNDLTFRETGQVLIFNQLVMELWAAAMNFSDAAGLDVDKTRDALINYL